MLIELGQTLQIPDASRILKSKLDVELLKRLTVTLFEY